MKTAWPVKPLRELADRIFVGIAAAATHAYRDSGVLLLRNLNIKESGIDQSDQIFIDPEYEKQHARKRLLAGDVLTVRTGFAGISAVVPDELENSQCFTSLVTRPKKSLLDSCYLAYFLNSPLGEKSFSRSEAGGSQKNVNAGELEQLLVTVPPIAVQRQIALVLGKWDAAIKKTEQLIAAKNLRLSYLREHNLNKPKQPIRTKLHAVTHESTARNGKRLGREAIMAVTKQHGMRPMREETIAAAIDRYKIVRPNAFAYNPMRLNIGSIAMSSFGNDVLVSPDYVVFECDEGKLLPGYLNHLRRTRLWISYFEAAGSGGVRIRIYYDDLGAFIFPLPPLAEQARVVALLDAGVAEIETLERYLAALKIQKRGLMQKLLTGQWRVKANPDKVAA